MSAFSKIDMAEVTRLTRAGKLAEATAMLRGRASSDGNEAAAPPAPTLALAAPTLAGETKASAAPAFVKRLLDFRNRRAARGPSGFTRRTPPVVVPAGARFEERAFASDAGSRDYKVYIPSGYAGQALPVVMMLHGCTQDPDDFAAGTGMNEIAEQETFLVVYPRQPQSANMQKCWNWFNAGDQQRGQGEPSLIAGIALEVVREFSADPTRVYVAGLSAGGAAAAIMAATYPDVFAAVGVHSGLACGVARDMPSAFAAMSGNGVASARGAGSSVPTIIFHGDADKTVNLVNGEQVAAQAAPRVALTRTVTHGQSTGGRTYTRIVQRDDRGREIVEQWVLHGAGHAWSGGRAGGSYTDAAGPDASREMVRFFFGHAIDR